ncbi:hypothetical protein F0562_018704 [Nyssa sinensis]|uniref:Uncharacterized protein n=1 Tax=Nyssa sinensis TaxID=561372 RepID=A0A5J4ZAR2_9ASTE|nr:hypothetical protein F0562_018704 [Nyssa sinensis]
MGKPDPMGKDKAGNNNKTKLRKGLWSPEEDEKLMNYMLRNGHGCWSDIARNAGLQRWSQIAARLPGRTDNEIKNFWNSTVKKRLKNNTTSTPSPNNTTEVLSDQPRDHVMGGGFMSMSTQEHDNIMAMCMDSSSTSSSSSMHGMLTANHFDHPFPLLDNGYDIAGDAAGFFNVSTCMGDGFCGDYGIVEDGMMRLESDISIPSLERKGIVENNVGATAADYTFDKRSDNNHFNNYESIKVEDMSGFGNHWQGENLRMGEWDWDALLENVTSFPYLDFQVE